MKHPSQTAHHTANEPDFPGNSSEGGDAKTGAAAKPLPNERQSCVAFFIHGTPGLGDDWGAVAAALKELAPDCRVLAFDRPGFGERAREDARWSFDGQLDLFEQLLRKEPKGQPLVVVGHSYGAALALGLANRLEGGGQLAGLALVSGVLAPDVTHQKWYHRLLKMPASRVFFPRKLRRAADEMSAVQQKLGPLDSYWDDCSVPVRLIHGDADRVVAYRNSEHVLERVGSAQATLKRVPGGGHALIATHARLVAEAIASLAESIELKEKGAK